MAQKPRVLEFEVEVAADGTARSGVGGSAIAPEESWQAEHLVLAGFVRCTLASLAYAARRAKLEVTARGSARGTVTKRDEDGLYAFVEIEAAYEVEVQPRPPPQSLTELLDWAERGCFVGNSLTAAPRYRWTVNGDAFR
jgi:organic hydroperoxide reductase OsmC/OhrA